MSKPDLSVEFCGITFENPFLLASAPPTSNARKAKLAAKAGWGGFVTKTIGMEGTPHPRPRLGVIKSGKRRVGINNIELISEHDLDHWVQEIKKCKEAGIPIIASIMAAGEPADWAIIAQVMEEAGADMLELNCSCPHGMPESGMGMAIGQDPDLTAEVTKGAKEGAPSLPIMPKMTPNVTDITSVAKTAVEVGGADAISATNTVLSLIGIDIHDAVPLPNVLGRSSFGGYAGSAIRPISLRCVAEIAQGLGPSVPLSGIGGIDTWQNAVEFMMVGASTVQVCTAVMLRGFKIISRMKKGLTEFMVEQEYSGINEFVGKALPHIVAFEELPLEESQKYIAGIDKEKCNGCDICVVSCTDAGFNAMQLNEDKTLAIVDQEACDGCSLCIVVCPRDAVSMIKVF